MEIKLKLSNTNEESFRLEISKLNLSLADKDKENSLLKRENQSLKEQLNSFEKHLKNILEENSKYRRDIENKVFPQLM
jgi:septal ring factor EnvC (AmiA/AmiB activator)